jgi:hypothetical protein
MVASGRRAMVLPQDEVVGQLRSSCRKESTELDGGWKGDEYGMGDGVGWLSTIEGDSGNFA